jgi:hypothetical protein
MLCCKCEQILLPEILNAHRSHQEVIMTKTVEDMAAAPMAAATEALKGNYAKMQAAGALMAEHNKANMEALMESSKITFKSFEDAAAITTAYTKDATQKAGVALKALTGSKSIQEAVEVHADYTRGALDRYFSEFNKVADVFLGAMKAASKPISDRASASFSAMQAAK